MDTRVYEHAVAVLGEGLFDLRNSQRAEQILEWRDEVLGRFQKSFSIEFVSQLEQEEFRAFLDDKINHHWSGLYRTGPAMCADMSMLRKALAILLDKKQQIEDRLDWTINEVNGMGKAVATAILLIAYPGEYGVWNNTSERGLKALNLWPRFKRGESLGRRYAKINRILKRLTADLQTDLWTLDTLWWGVLDADDKPPRLEGTGDVLKFRLERHLQDFLRDNWENIPLGKEWDIYSEPGEPGKGYEYPCGLWSIDLLAQHKTEPRWLVIELKRGQTSDATVGQVLRYMGWVKTHLSEPGEEIYGLVIAHEADEALRYALSILPNIDLQLYEVKFQLHPVPKPGEEQV